MESYKINLLIHYWLTHPEATMVDSLKYALVEGIVSNPPHQDDIDRVMKEYDIFSKRRSKTLNTSEEPLHWSQPYDIPLGSNPFMESFDGDKE
jgi:hypothetical protein